jgi:hypothetical protein
VNYSLSLSTVKYSLINSIIPINSLSNFTFINIIFIMGKRNNFLLCLILVSSSSFILNPPFCPNFERPKPLSLRSMNRFLVCIRYRLSFLDNCIDMFDSHVLSLYNCTKIINIWRKQPYWIYKIFDLYMDGILNVFF